MFEDRENNMWIDTDEGVFRYNLKNKALKKFSKQDGLLDNVCFGFREDNKGNIYMGTQFGFNMITADDKVHGYSAKKMDYVTTAAKVFCRMMPAICGLQTVKA